MPAHIARPGGACSRWRPAVGEDPPPPSGTTFAGIADGAAWPAPWAAGKVPATGSVTVQSEQGRLSTGSAVGNYSSDDGTSARYTTQAADCRRRGAQTWTTR